MTRTFKVDCHGYLPFHDCPAVTRTMTEAQVVAHVLRCRNGHSILLDGEPCFVVRAA